MARPLASSTRWLLAAGAVVVLVAVAGLVAGNTDGATDDLDEDAPAATVRDFLEALEERDVAGVRATLSAPLRGACTEDEVRRGTREQPRSDVRATLVGTEELDGIAEVEIRRTEHHGEPPFGGGAYERTEVFELTHEDGAWRISHVPWGYHACPGWSR